MECSSENYELELEPVAPQSAAMFTVAVNLQFIGCHRLGLQAANRASIDFRYAEIGSLVDNTGEHRQRRKPAGTHGSLS